MPETSLEINVRNGWSADALRGHLAALRAPAADDLELVIAADTDASAPISGLAECLDCGPQRAGVTGRIASGPALADPGFQDEIILFFKSLNSKAPAVLDVDPASDVTSYRLNGKGPLGPLMALTARLRDSGLSVTWRLPLVAGLIHRLDGLATLARETGAGTILCPDDRSSASSKLSPDDQLFVWDFVTYRCLQEDGNRLGVAKLAYYRALANVLFENKLGEKLETVLVMETNGNAGFVPSPRPYPSAALYRAALATGATGARPAAPLSRIAALVPEVAEVFSDGLRSHIAAPLRASGPLAALAQDPAPRLRNVVLIGAYGGEHIGDFAILGGVLRRLSARYGTTGAVLMTQRPNHTRHLIPMLDTPVAIEVEDYSYGAIRARIGAADAVVYAGGPLTDIPKQLIRHLYAAALAKRAGKPFIAEGIGPNVFPRLPSKITARRMIRLADRISIRTSQDADKNIVAGLELTVGRDPAFDYLETRPEALTRLPAREIDEIARLLEGAEGRPVIGVNIRPVGHLFTYGAPGGDKAAYTREVEERCERELAKGLADHAARAGRPPVFVFFPMNAIQFGMSDLRSAHRIVRHLPAGTDFRIWEADASLDGVVALIRRLDLVIAMRFHAAIFALSQNCPTIGIDYRIGKADKVTAVMADAGQSAHCCRMDELTADWLAGQIGRRLAERG